MMHLRSLRLHVATILLCSLTGKYGHTDDFPLGMDNADRVLSLQELADRKSR